jgi:hypothetical protein
MCNPVAAIAAVAGGMMASRAMHHPSPPAYVPPPPPPPLPPPPPPELHPLNPSLGAKKPTLARRQHPSRPRRNNAQAALLPELGYMMMPGLNIPQIAPRHDDQ